MEHHGTGQMTTGQQSDKQRNTCRNEPVDATMDNGPEEANQQDWVATRSGETDTQNNSQGWSSANLPVPTGT